MYRDNALRKDSYYDYPVYNKYYENNAVTAPAKPKQDRPARPLPAPKPKRRKKTSAGNLVVRMFILSVLCALAYYIFPFSCHTLASTFCISKTNNVSQKETLCSNSFSPKSGVDYNAFINPTLSYSSNYTFMNERLPLEAKTGKKAKMTPIKYGENLTDLENKLNTLGKNYTSLKPSVFVWSIDNYGYASINSKDTYSCASIIKLPILIQLYKSVEAEQFGINDIMTLTEYYRSSGSGNMQYSQAGNKYSLYQLATLMIQDSDNTATNMLISKVGSMNDINAALKNWGIKHTSVRTWLPDLTGNNYTTAEDLAQMLYNITDDNNSFLNVNSQSDIINIMGKVKNVSLIKSGLPEGVDFIHKTGDIGSMLGDAGVVYMPSGQRYIVVIMVQRPNNDCSAKLYIQQASRIIYDYMSNRL